MPALEPLEPPFDLASGLDYFDTSRAADAHLAVRQAFRFDMGTGAILLDSPVDAEDLALLKGSRSIEVTLSVPASALVHVGWMEAGGTPPTWPNGLFVVKAAGGNVWAPHRKESGTDVAGTPTVTVAEPGPVTVAVGIGRVQGKTIGWIVVNGTTLMAINNLAISSRLLPRIYASTGSGDVDLMAYRKVIHE